MKDWGHSDWRRALNSDRSDWGVDGHYPRIAVGLRLNVRVMQLLLRTKDER